MTMLLVFAFVVCCLMGVLWACLHVAADRTPAEQDMDDMEQLAAVTRPATLEETK